MSRTLPWVILATVVTVLCPPSSAAQTARPAADGPPDFTVEVFGEHVTDFASQVQGYSALRGRLERRLPAIPVTADVGQIRAGIRTLARAIRSARPGAVQGEFFSVVISVEFRSLLAILATEEVCTVIMDENPGSFTHDINGSYPEGKSRSATPAIILARLPSLPDDIQYRFTGQHLILYDVRANTIIDRLPDAVRCTDNVGE